MIWDSENIQDQSGRTCLITGANSGLGYETAKFLFRRGAQVILGCRSIEKAQLSKQKLLSYKSSGSVEILELDLADLRKVDDAVIEIFKKYSKLDLLINNAGIMAPPRTLSAQGLEIQFAVNHIAHMALTIKLLPLLQKHPGSRIVTVTSAAQYLGKIAWDDLQGDIKYDRWASYSQSKLANVMFALELQNNFCGNKNRPISLLAHPGLARTNLQPKSVEMNGYWHEALAYKLIDPMFQSARMGALPQLMASTSLSVKEGQQFGPKFSFRGYPRLCKIASKALDDNQRRKLWKISEEIINVNSN